MILSEKFCFITVHLLNDECLLQRRARRDTQSNLWTFSLFCSVFQGADIPGDTLRPADTGTIYADIDMI